MIQASPALLDARPDVDSDIREGGDQIHTSSARPARADIHITVHEDLVGIERDWRAFEQRADCTAFQCFEWAGAWQRHIGSRAGVLPAIVVGRSGDGSILFLFPLAVEPGRLVRRLTWLGSELCDYNAPLLAPDFSAQVSPARFGELWREILQRLQRNSALRHDVVCLEKMTGQVGGQDNPFTRLGVARNPNGAYRTPLGDDWDKFYVDKRSSASRRRDRSRRKRLAEIGEVRFVNSPQPDETSVGFQALIDQKTRTLASMGACNIFALPGYMAFFHELATSPATRQFVHVSRLDVGSTTIAANLGLVFRGSFYHVLTSYDDGELSRFAPGVLHLHDVLRDAMERGCRVFDFTIGDERFKREWCDDVMTIYDHVSVASWRGAPAVAMAAAMRALKRHIKQTPALWSAVSRLRAFLGPLRRR